VAFAIYFTGLLLIAAAAWAAASPLFEPPGAAPNEPEAPGHERWRRQKEESLAAIKDAEFDFHLGKLSETDYQKLRARLEAQALEAIDQLERPKHGDSR
jgi:hypothetical protein